MSGRVAGWSSNIPGTPKLLITGLFTLWFLKGRATYVLLVLEVTNPFQRKSEAPLSTPGSVVTLVSV